MTAPDAWGRMPSEGSGRSADQWHRRSGTFEGDEPETTVNRREPLVWSIARAVLLGVGGMLALPLALQAGYGGVSLLIVVVIASLAPAALVCGVKAGGPKGSDRWTAGYFAAYALCVFVLVPVGTALRTIG